MRDLLRNLSVATATTIRRIHRNAATWHLEDDRGAVHGPFAAVAITFPAPQVAALLDASGLALPGVERAIYAPCWSLMIATEIGVAANLIEPRRAPISLIACDSSKPGRPGGTRLTVHTTPAWSRLHLEEPREAIVSALVQATEEELGADLRPAYAGAHRWRYAAVETALGRPCLYDGTMRLGAAGDWCLGPRIEAAHDSGLALAEAILTDRVLAA
ncbi:NAD(P)/FAD-dependent oxidoreductase [Methylobacterium sp. A49B]